MRPGHTYLHLLLISILWIKKLFLFPKSCLHSNLDYNNSAKIVSQWKFGWLKFIQLGEKHSLITFTPVQTDCSKICLTNVTWIWRTCSLQAQHLPSAVPKHKHNRYVQVKSPCSQVCEKKIKTHSLRMGFVITFHNTFNLDEYMMMVTFSRRLSL